MFASLDSTSTQIPPQVVVAKKRGRTKSEDAARKRLSRGVHVSVPSCADRALREELEKDDVAWLRHFFGGTCPRRDKGLFWHPFTDDHLEIVAALRSAFLFGGDQSIADSRGGGKTTVARRMALKYLLTGNIRFPIFFAANGRKANEILQATKADLTNPELVRLYPEACYPIVALENKHQRAKTMMIRGKRHDNGEPYADHPANFRWAGNSVIFPHVPGSPSSGSVMAAVSLEAEVRGESIAGLRPDVAIIDDPGTEETARNPDQSAKLGERIDSGIGGLGDPSRPIGRIMLVTCQSAIDVSAVFTDRKQRPSWKGRRFRYLVEPPTNAHLWDTYCQMLREDYQNGDEYGRRANAFYVANESEMNAGAKVANPYRFNRTILPDGTQAEQSALQAFYNFVVSRGAKAAETELNNNPPEENEAESGLLRPVDLIRRLSDFGRGIVPPGCTLVTQGIDCHGPGDPTRQGKSKGLVWVVVAWKPDGTCYVIDFGHTDWVPLGTRHTIEEAHAADDVDIPRALRRRRDEWLANPPRDEAGHAVPIRATMIDVRYREEAISNVLREIPSAIGWYGHGKSGGCVKSGGYSPPSNSPAVGDGWYIRPGTREFHANADRWKEFVHDRCRITPGEPSALWMFSPSKCESEKAAQAHIAELAEHICGEQIVVEPNKAGIMVRNFHGIDAGGRITGGAARVNHGLDALAMASAAANLLGIRLGESMILPIKSTPRRRADRGEVLGAR